MKRIELKVLGGVLNLWQQFFQELSQIEKFTPRKAGLLVELDPFRKCQPFLKGSHD